MLFIPGVLSYASRKPTVAGHDGAGRHLSTSSSGAFLPQMCHLKRGLALLSRRPYAPNQHFYSAFAPMASEVIYMAAPGAVPPIMQQIPYQRMRTDNKFPWVEDPFSTINTNKINQENVYE